jgi:hypothetical protein
MLTVSKLLEMKCLALAQLVFVAFLLQVPCASAQQVVGRFYPEKVQCLVGEPIIVDFEVVNGTDNVAEISEDNCRRMNPRQFEVDGATPQNASSARSMG